MEVLDNIGVPRAFTFRWQWSARLGGDISQRASEFHLRPANYPHHSVGNRFGRHI